MKRFALVAGVSAAAALALTGCSAGGDSGSPPSTSGGTAVQSVAAGVAQPQVGLAAATTTAPAAGAGTDRNSITAQGVGKITGTPDVLTISLGVETRAAAAKDAIDQNNAAAADVIAVLKDSGVEPADLQTNDLSVYPTYSDKNVITGYQVTNSVTAVLRDISGSGAVIDAVAEKAGNAVRVQQLSFSIDDDSDLRAAARAAAVKQAQAQAKQLADAAGVQLGAVHSIVESSASAPMPMYAADQSMAAGSSPVPIEPGSQELSVVVQVVYDIAS